MKTVIALVIVLVLIAILLSQPYQGDCRKYQDEILAFIDEKNYCTTDLDCAINVKDFDCPFGCWQIINKDANLFKTKQLMRNYHKKCGICDYDCVFGPKPEDIKCVNEKCVNTKTEKFCLNDNDCGFYYVSDECRCFNRNWWGVVWEGRQQLDECMTDNECL